MSYNHKKISDETDFIELHSLKLNFTSIQYVSLNQDGKCDYFKRVFC